MAEETIISDLEQAPLLTDDMVIAVEDTKNTYSATLAQLRELVNKLFVEKENIDFNTLTDDGFYQVGGTLTNAPVSGSITWIVQVVKVGTVIVQNALATDATNYSRQFVRRYNGTSWGTWDVVGGKIIQSLTSSTTDVPCSKAVNDAVNTRQSNSNLSQTIDTSTTKYPSNNAVKEYIKTIYPVGSLYFSTASTCPLQTLGIGTWNKVGTSLTLSVNTSVPVKGNGKTLGLTGSTNVGISSNNNNAGTGIVIVRTGIYGQPAGSGVTGNAPDQTSLGVTTDSANSGIVGTVTRTQLTVNVFQRTA